MTSTRATFEEFLAWLEEGRTHGQVHFDDKQQCWQVLGHPEANAVLSDPARFSSDLSALQPDQYDLALFQRGNFVRMDPPQHRKLRTLVSQAFTPRAVAALEPRIAELTAQLIEPLGERFDLIDALAYPLPVVVIAELLGVPTTDQALFRSWADQLLGVDRDHDRPISEVVEQSLTSFVPAMREMNAYFLDHIRSRRTTPTQDLTSKLVLAQVDGERLADEEIIGFVGLLLIAGHITTTATLGNSVVTFADNPAAVAEIRADPTLLPAAIEEVLRVRTPFPRLTRLTAVDTHVGGVDIPAGQVVLPWVAAANRDARVFADPHRFDIHRTPNPHLSFGHGIHFCLGAPLARLEARVALRLLLGRYRDIEVATDEPVEHRDPWTMEAVTRLPLAVRAV
ncbi:MAG TPA: cytochrome P450 [Pseudonocardiaceae bacterium]|nr:cytochrome P450 [Pseudonocardiaceae bacterium]